jgi:hypothetical protein
MAAAITPMTARNASACGLSRKGSKPRNPLQKPMVSPMFSTG